MWPWQWMFGQFIHTFKHYLSKHYYISCTFPDTEDTITKNKPDKLPVLEHLILQWRLLVYDQQNLLWGSNGKQSFCTPEYLLLPGTLILPDTQGWYWCTQSRVQEWSGRRWKPSLWQSSWINSGDQSTASFQKRSVLPLTSSCLTSWYLMYVR